MGRQIWLCACLVWSFGCDVFLPSAGYLDQPCNEDGSCEHDYACINDRCVEAGHKDQPCRVQGLCYGELECIAGNCIEAGEVSQHCRADGSCDDASLACLSGRCERAGGAYEPCRPDGSCNSGLVCQTSGVCATACGDETCNGNEDWNSCRHDCPLPPAASWSDPNGKCATSTTVNDATGSDWTWVNANTRQLMWTDGLDVFVLTGTWTSSGGGLYLNDVLIAWAACGQTSAGDCHFFWVSADWGHYVDFSRTGDGFEYRNAAAWAACP